MEPIRFLQAQPEFRVRSLNESLAFYEQLGFKETFRNDDFHVVINKDDVVIHLSTIEGHQTGCHILVDDVDRMHDFVMTRGLKILYEIGDRVWGNRDFTTADPDGNEITFASRSA